MCLWAYKLHTFCVCHMTKLMHVVLIFNFLRLENTLHEAVRCFQFCSTPMHSFSVVLRKAGSIVLSCTYPFCNSVSNKTILQIAYELMKWFRRTALRIAAIKGKWIALFACLSLTTSDFPTVLVTIKFFPAYGSFCVEV